MTSFISTRLQISAPHGRGWERKYRVPPGWSIILATGFAGLAGVAAEATGEQIRSSMINCPP